MKRCTHNFKDGVCKKCCCPKTPKDQAKAEAELYRREDSKYRTPKKKA